jgi:hypothetical protein
MELQECAKLFKIDDDHPDIPKNTDLQFRMINSQIMFQKRMKAMDKRLRDYGSSTYCMPKVAIHHLDMAAQECAEAWDQVEGGWKHHKKNPSPSDKEELLMELVDVAHFIINAYIFMGGQPESELMAKSVHKAGLTRILTQRLTLDDIWRKAERFTDENEFRQRLSMYDHGKGSFGEKWEKDCATRINYLTSQIFDTKEAIRYQFTQINYLINGTKFPPASGFVYFGTMPWLCFAAQSIPGVTLEIFYHAFMHKNTINNQRQDNNY